MLITRFLLCGADSIQSKTNRLCGRITYPTQSQYALDGGWELTAGHHDDDSFKICFFFFFFQLSVCISLHKSLLLHIIYSFVTAIGVYYIKTMGCRLIYGLKVDEKR